MREYYNVTDTVEKDGMSKIAQCPCGGTANVAYYFATFSCPDCNAILADSRHDDRKPLENTEGQSRLGQWV